MCFISFHAAADEDYQAKLTNGTGTVYYKANGRQAVPVSPPRELYDQDLVRTWTNSTAVIWMRNDNTQIKLPELSALQILAPENKSGIWMNLLQGALYFFSRGESQQIFIRTPHVTAAHQGTEFVLTVDKDRTVMVVLDGVASMTNQWGSASLTNGDVGVALNGRPPAKSRIEAKNLVQWWLYYPGVLDVDELPFTQAERTALKASIAAYRSGDLAAALSHYPGYPAPQEPVSDQGKTYLAALYLAQGEVGKCENLLTNLLTNSSLAQSLRWVIAAVQDNVSQPPQVHTSASEWLGLSYYYQARNEPDRLAKALNAAYKSVAIAPDFAFAWERVAELEFGFGRTEKAQAALDKSLQLAPRNAEAHALAGFLLCAQNRLTAARDEFQEAIRLDPNLGNAWLGRGLVRIRSRDTAGGLADLKMAVILEPNRSLLRSYLGKAYADAWLDKNATLEFDRAKGLDTNDPTPWLYSALQNSDENKVNGAVNDLEKSIALNDNRAVYRSQLLLDQDKATRSANLAALYNDAGMTDISVDEASKSVIDDYANFSAHLFLANSYNELRDPNLINTRYETATFSEYLLANLLSPIGGSKLSSYVSQQDYSELFDQEGPHFSSQSTYLSTGDWLQQGALYGWQKNTAYAATVYYRSQASEPGRVNDDLQQYGVSAQVKQQLTPNDSAYIEADFNGLQSGDVRQYYNQSSADPKLSVNDHQNPNLFFGYHHEWSPEIHTLLLGGRLEDHFTLSDGDRPIPAVITNGNGAVVDSMEHYAESMGFSDVDTFNSLDLDSRYVVYSAELQQIAEISRHTLVFGGRYQNGEITTDSEQQRSAVSFIFLNPGQEFTASQQNKTSLIRLNFYGYDQWQILDPLWVTAGLSYDWLQYPENVDTPPISDDEQTARRLSPKAGFVWTPATDTTIRGAFTRSLGGLSYDTSIRLEPVQVAGFDQAFRSVIPESVEGSVPGSKFQTFDLGFEQKFKSRTYLNLQLELLQSEANLWTGAFIYDPNLVPRNYVGQTQIEQDLKYWERSLTLSLNQLLGRDLAFGVDYKLSDTDLKTDYPDLAGTLFPYTHQNALLHTLDLNAIFNHPSGFFAEAQALWRGQSNFNDDADLPGDNFWQFNLFAGWRFAHRHAELTFGLLNLTDQNYQLNPLSYYDELPRNRTLEVSLQLIF